MHTDSDSSQVLDQFRLDHKKALVTGGSGGLGSVMGKALAEAGAEVWIGNRHLEKGQQVAESFQQKNLQVEAIQLDVLDRESLEAAAGQLGPVDILVNAAGGNRPEATTSDRLSFFDLPEEALHHVFGLNLFGGAILPCQVFGRAMKDKPEGAVILNVSSMSALRPLTRVVGYSAAKAAVNNFTQWLAVHLAQEYHPQLRVNALAPGFFLTEQNRYLLTDPDSGEWTARGQSIIAHTPMHRMGKPEDLAGATLWLCSEASAFVTGMVVPVDGGFSAFSGV